MNAAVTEKWVDAADKRPITAHGFRATFRTWAEEVRRKYHFHAEVIAVEEATDRTVVTAHLTGDFPGNPVDLQYRFKLTGPEIIALEIG